MGAVFGVLVGAGVAMKSMNRILIIGGPRTGKTMLANRLGIQLGMLARHTDDVAATGWSEASQAASEWIDPDVSWIIEGVAMGRAMRKWLAANPGRPLAAKVILLGKAHETLTVVLVLLIIFLIKRT